MKIAKTYAVIPCLFILFIIVEVRWIYAQELECCSQVTGSCRSLCEKMSLVEMAANVNVKNKTVFQLQTFCSPQLTTFWECLNETLLEMSKGEFWSGRTCCPLPQSARCQRQCISAVTRDDLFDGCRKSDELEFYTCLDRQEQGDKCCGNSVTDECKRACMEIYKSHKTSTREQRNRVTNMCQDTSPKVLQCVKNFTKVTPATNSHKHLHCCEKAENTPCRDACKKVLKSKTTHQEIADSLQEECGPPLFQDMFWQCFLKTSDSVSPSVEVSRIDRLGMDSAKLHCCQRAGSVQCRKLCAKTFTNDWSRLWEDFDNKCLSQLAEEDLRNCIDEVEEPCELGCDGLSYCTNFNNRPTDLFRACTPAADEAAMFDVTYWQHQGFFSLPGLQLSVRNISRCSPNTWKAVACTLQIKPCARHSHATQICRDACEDVLNECMDWSKTSSEHTVASVCSKLSPENPNTPCISLQDFMKPSDNPYTLQRDQISSPCKGDPCGPSQICAINRNCIPGTNCRPYTCSSGCKMGEVSQYLVPDGAHVRIPIATGQNGCLKICKCVQGNIEECQPLPCFLLEPCWLGKDKIDHGASFYMDCNTCSCFAGEIICSKRQCNGNSLSLIDPSYTTLPCNCPTHYTPACGRNGVNYPNLCLARCAGLSDADIEYGSCEDPCENNPCPIGQQCVADPKVCLSLLHKPCKQYECVNSTVNCSKLPQNIVCDTNNQEHANGCFLLRRGKKLAYRGPCLYNCNHNNTICGINGKTYLSECAARADYVTVDYPGPCITVGVIGDLKAEQCSDKIQCAPLPRSNCVGYTPPGACCPICGGVLRLLYSRKQIDRALYALHGHSLSSLTLKSILNALERQIQVAQCALRGYLSMELDIIVLVQSIVVPPSELQLEACVREAEKLASLVVRQSPRVASELSLSALTSAMVVHTTDQYNRSVNLHRTETYMVLLFMLLIRTIIF